jgi:hypothetical protein
MLHVCIIDPIVYCPVTTKLLVWALGFVSEVKDCGLTWKSNTNVKDRNPENKWGQQLNGILYNDLDTTETYQKFRLPKKFCIGGANCAISHSLNLYQYNLNAESKALYLTKHLHEIECTRFLRLLPWHNAEHRRYFHESVFRHTSRLAYWCNCSSANGILSLAAISMSL